MRRRNADRLNFATYVAGTLSTASTINGLEFDRDL